MVKHNGLKEEADQNSWKGVPAQDNAHQTVEHKMDAEDLEQVMREGLSKRVEEAVELATQAKQEAERAAKLAADAKDEAQVAKADANRAVLEANQAKIQVQGLKDDIGDFNFEDTQKMIDYLDKMADCADANNEMLAFYVNNGVDGVVSKWSRTGNDITVDEVGAGHSVQIM